MDDLLNWAPGVRRCAPHAPAREPLEASLRTHPVALHLRRAKWASPWQTQSQDDSECARWTECFPFEVVSHLYLVCNSLLN